MRAHAARNHSTILEYAATKAVVYVTTAVVRSNNRVEYGTTAVVYGTTAVVYGQRAWEKTFSTHPHPHPLTCSLSHAHSGALSRSPALCGACSHELHGLADAQVKEPQTTAGAFLSVAPRRIFLLVEPTAASKQALLWAASALIRPEEDLVYLVLLQCAKPSAGLVARLLLALLACCSCSLCWPSVPAICCPSALDCACRLPRAARLWTGLETRPNVSYHL